jgi:hypothetical protein
MNKQNKNKRKQKVWTDALNEQLLCDDLNEIGKLRQTNSNSLVKIERGVETYQYSTKNDENKKQNETADKNHLVLGIKLDDQKNNNKPITPQVSGKATLLTERIGPSVEFDENKSRPHILVTELDSESAVVKEIVKQLNETKSDLIRERANVTF